MTQTKPTIIELDMDKVEEILRRVEAKELQADDYETIKALAQSYVHLTELLKDKNTTSLSRLRKMLFGAKTEKTAAVLGSSQAIGHSLAARRRCAPQVAPGNQRRNQSGRQRRNQRGE